jgi:sulfur carrier protein
VSGTLLVNGSTRQLLPGTTLSELVEAVCASAEGIAVARNSEVVPRSEWPVTALENGDRVEIVTAAAGG